MDFKQEKRLIITHIYLENFKSYGGSQVIGPLHKGLNAIVGPNGSGKSNLIDALLFVFARRAKQLRMSKLSDLAYNSKKYSGKLNTKVDLHFAEVINQYGDDTQIISGSNFIISRTFDSSSKSEYYINKQLSSASEVTRLLCQKRINIENRRFFILQGHVEQIANMKPKATKADEFGLLEYIEDVVGTKKYIEPIEKIETKLVEISANCNSITERLKVISSDQISLESSMSKLEVYQSDECQFLCISLIQAHFVLYKRNIDCIRCRLGHQTLICKHTEEKEKLKHIELISKRISNEFNHIKLEHDLIMRKQKLIIKEFNNHEQRDINCTEEIKLLKSTNKKLFKKISNNNTEFTTSKTRLKEMTRKLSKIKSKIKTLLNILERSKTIRLLEDKNIEKKISDLRHGINNLTAKLITLECYNNAISRLNLIAHDAIKIKNQDKKRDDNMILKINHDVHIRDLYFKKKEIQKNIIYKNKVLQEIIRAIYGTKKLEIYFEKISNALVKTKGLFNEFQNSSRMRQNWNTVIHRMNYLRDSKTIQGILGRLGDLGTIDIEYETAINTACFALDFIVVENLVTAQKCTEYLRNNNLGIATFLILEKLHHLLKPMNEIVVVPYSTVRLFDKVEVLDDNVKVAFYFGLGDCLVTDNLDRATLIAYDPSNSRFRKIVTLHGELIQESGTMTGGGNKQKNGKIIVRQNDDTLLTTSMNANQIQKCYILEKDMNTLHNLQTRQANKLMVFNHLIGQLKEIKRKLESIILKIKLDSCVTKKTVIYDESQIIDNIVASKYLNKRIIEKFSKFDILNLCLKKLQQYKQILEKHINIVCLKINERNNKIVTTIEYQIKKLQKLVFEYNVQRQLFHKKNQRLHNESLNINDQINQTDFMIKNKIKLSKLIEEQAFSVMESFEKYQILKKNDQKKITTIMNEMEQIQTSLNNTKAIEATFGVKIKAYVEKEEKLLKIVETQINIYNKIIDEASCSLICNGFEPEQVHDIILNTKTFGEKYLISSRRLKISITNFQQKSSKNQFSKNTDSRLETQPLEKINNYLEPIENEISKLKTVLKDKANNTINMDDLNDYKRKRVEHDEKIKEFRESFAKKDCLRIEYESLQSKRLDEFLTEFDKICCNLKEIYQMVTLGGDAELELVDSLDPFSKGISISVRPPNKSWKVITNLSGGEKTISSLSLVLALHKYKSSPFYVMDEIDAALDFKNVSILGHYLKDWTHDTQFIIVSLRNNLFELADRLVGLYKTNNYTQSILINPVFIGIK